MQAIETRFLSPTDRRGSRVKVQAYAGSLTIEWNHELGIDDNHRAAALEFAKKKDWNTVERKLISGTLKGGAQVHILVSKDFF